MKKSAKTYVVAGAVGIALTPLAVQFAAVERGYSGAIGGDDNV